MRIGGGGPGGDSVVPRIEVRQTGALATWKPAARLLHTSTDLLVTQHALPLVYLHSKSIHQNILQKLHYINVTDTKDHLCVTDMNGKRRV